jgi:hypothetical protein
LEWTFVPDVAILYGCRELGILSGAEKVFAGLVAHLLAKKLD